MHCVSQVLLQANCLRSLWWAGHFSVQLFVHGCVAHSCRSEVMIQLLAKTLQSLAVQLSPDAPRPV